MKLAALVMIVMVVLLVGVSYSRGGTALVIQGLRAGGSSTLKLLPLLVVVFLLTGFVEVLLPRDTAVKWLSDAAGAKGLVIAWAAGIVTPGGGPIGLPIAASLMRAGASTSVLVTYLTSVGLLSFIRVPMEIGIYGVRLTVYRLACSVLLPFVAGGIARVIS
jgi:uncharacterized membrane protein YraQ (UPF0718 family)